MSANKAAPPSTNPPADNAGNETIHDLRTELFATMRGLRDGSVAIDKAKTIAAIGQVIVDSARVEADVMKVTKHRGSGFIPEALPSPTLPGAPRLVDKGMGNG